MTPSSRRKYHHGKVSENELFSPLQDATLHYIALSVLYGDKDQRQGGYDS